VKPRSPSYDGSLLGGMHGYHGSQPDGDASEIPWKGNQPLGPVASSHRGHSATWGTSPSTDARSPGPQGPAPILHVLPPPNTGTFPPIKKNILKNNAVPVFFCRGVFLRYVRRIPKIVASL